MQMAVRQLLSESLTMASVLSLYMDCFDYIKYEQRRGYLEFSQVVVQQAREARSQGVELLDYPIHSLQWQQLSGHQNDNALRDVEDVLNMQASATVCSIHHRQARRDHRLEIWWE